jgi:hypothetical protein
MKRKVDFTVKGTKLPLIPNGTKYYLENMKDVYVLIHFEMENMVSFGIASECEIFAEFFGYIGKHKYIFHISTIESLAEKQGMLWVDDEAPKSKTTSIPSIEQLLIDCITLNNYIKRGERLFDFDNRYKLKLLQDSQSKLASKVAELNTILNPLSMQSIVEIAEDVLK